MKRKGNLFETILSRPNLRLATAKALKGKRRRDDARAWVADLEANLRRAAETLRAGTFPVGRARRFVILDPKERVITAPCFEERVMHHAVVNVCEGHFERRLIDDTFACRRGKGRDACLERAGGFARRYGHFLKADVRKYFDSVPHGRLLERLERVFKDRRLLDLFAAVVDGYRTTPGRGLPIGSLTSQHFANLYLGELDRFVKETLRLPGYVRYMDDIAAWSDDTPTLAAAEARIREYLDVELALTVKPEPYRNRTAHGMDLLGCRIYPTHRKLNRRSATRYRRKLRGLEAAYAAGDIDEAELQRRATSLTAFAKSGGVSSWHQRRRAISGDAVGGPEA